MRLFQILPDQLHPTQRREQNRYLVGPEFPLGLTLSAENWSGQGRTIDLAMGGIGALFPADARFEANNVIQVTFKLEAFEITLLGRVRHVRPEQGGRLCGIRLVSGDTAGHQEYLQLLLPVAIGSSLGPVDAKRVRQDEPGVVKSIYEGESESRLTIWSRGEGPTAKAFSFELAVGDHLARGQEGGELKIFSHVDPLRKHRVSDVIAQGGNALDDEVRRLFKWSVLNLRDPVPAPARDFLISFLR